MIEGDSGEYEVIDEAVALSAHLYGMCIEIGVRRGKGTATIIDAVRKYCPDKYVVCVDPFGSIPYVGREHIGEIRLDYDNNMKVDCMIDLWNYVRENPVNFRPECLTDYEFFEKYKDGVPKYDIEHATENSYSMAHLDGPHNYEHVSKEILWFNERMLKGSTIVLDDITEDFIDIKPINELFISLGWAILKQGIKKGLYQKL